MTSTLIFCVETHTLESSWGEEDGPYSPLSSSPPLSTHSSSPYLMEIGLEGVEPAVVCDPENQRSPNFLAPGTVFHGIRGWAGWFKDDSSALLYCALYFFISVIIFLLHLRSPGIRP